MSTSIRHKKSSVAGKTPLAGDLEYGELAINYTDGRLHYKNNNNEIKSFVDSDGVPTIIDAHLASGISTIRYDHAIHESNTLTTSSTSITNLLTFAAATYGSMKVFVQGYNATLGERMVTELNIVHDGTTALANQYGTIFTGASELGQFDVDISAGNVRLRVTPANASSTVWKVMHIKVDA